MEAKVVALEKTVDELEAAFSNASNAEIVKLEKENHKLEYRLQHLNNAIKAEKEALENRDYSKDVSPLAILKHGFGVAISKAFPSIKRQAALILPPRDVNKWDYQCNNALALTKIVPEKKSPRDIAQLIVSHIPQNLSSILGGTEIAGPGFINIKFKTEWLSARLLQGFKNKFPANSGQAKKLVIDYSSPNIAKDMHVGHLRSTIIGDALGNLFEYLGYDVLRLNHVGDWGTQFGMLIAHLQDEFPNYATECPPIADLQAFYKASKKRFDSDEPFKARAYQNVVKLQSVPPEPSIYKGWKAICECSMANFTKVYKQLNVSPKLTVRGESFYNDQMKVLMAELKKTGKLKLDDGRYIYFPEGCSVPMTLIKSDGGFTYDTSDLTCLKHRVSHEKPDAILYVTDAGQSLHFEQFFKAGSELGIYDPASVRVEHVPFGVVLGEDKKKFKTRSGDTVKLSDLLQEARERVHNIMKERADEQGWTAEEFERNKHAVAMSCIKYSDLSSNREKAYIFSYDKMISFTGNTGAYLCYAYTRIMSIVRKCGFDLDQIHGFIGNVEVPLTGNPAERKLAKAILQWYDRVFQVEQELYTHVLCDWLFDLSKTFTEFYSNCYVIEKTDAGEVVNKDRLILVSATAMIMKEAFKVLGFLTTDKM